MIATGAVLVVVVVAGCAPKGGNGAESGSTAGGVLTVAGSDTMVNMAAAWAQAYMKQDPAVQIAVKGGGSGTGIAALINGQVDFADASREMKPEEISLARSRGIDPVGTEVARDGVTIIVNSSNTLTDLTVDQLGRIYRGEVTNWKAVGGPDRPISIISRDPSSGTYELFKERIVGKDKNYAKSAKLLASTQAIVTEVESDRNAIGYVGVGYETPAVKVVALNGVKASVETVLDGSYDLARFLYMYSNGQPKGLGKAYVDWILSPAGQGIVSKQGFVPLK